MNRQLLLLIIAVILTGCVRGAAEPSVPTLDALSEPPPPETVTGEAERYRLSSADGGLDAGGAVILVNAPLDEVLKVVLRYRDYHEILPRLEQSRVVAKTAESTDVYLRAPVLGGAVSLWAIVRFSPPEDWDEGGKKIDGTMVEGNLKQWQGAWKLRPQGPDKTILQLEMLIDIKLPIPDEWITPELMWAADMGVSSVRDIAEKNARAE